VETEKIDFSYTGVGLSLHGSLVKYHDDLIYDFCGTVYLDKNNVIVQGLNIHIELLSDYVGLKFDGFVSLESVEKIAWLIDRNMKREDKHNLRLLMV